MWRISISRGVASHDCGCDFRIVRTPLCAICTRAEPMLTLDDLATLQARATAVFGVTERLRKYACQS